MKQDLAQTFDRIATRYDLCNYFLSFGLYRMWQKKLVRSLLKNESDSLLDLCAGTGTIALDFAKNSKKAREIFLVDFSEKMLSLARSRAQKFKKARFHFIHSSIEALPLPSESVEAASLSFGARNSQNLPLALKEAHRVLKKGSRMALLELTRPRHPFLSSLHRFYLHAVVPSIGSLITGQKEAYRYLSSSIESFMAEEELKRLLEDVGFEEVSSVRLFFGVATLFFGKKAT